MRKKNIPFKGGKIYRGCISDQTESRKSCEKNDAICKRCDKEGCNDGSGAGNIKASLIILGITLTTTVIIGLIR